MRSGPARATAFRGAIPVADWPWATLTVNVVGCFAVGWGTVALVGGGTPTHEVEPWRLLCLTGFLGGFTTYSAFGLETVTLLQRGAVGSALGVVMAHLLLGLAAVWVGMRLG